MYILKLSFLFTLIHLTAFSQNQADSVFIDSLNFKYYNLTKFDLREWNYEKRKAELKTPTKNEIINYFQKLYSKKGSVQEWNYRFFSLQKNTTKEKIISIIRFDDGCCANLHLLSYNKVNKLISDNVIAGSGGDGMWYYDQYGKFLNDSTYVLTRIDTEETDLENGNDEFLIDSVIKTYLYKDGMKFIKLDENTFHKRIK